MDKNQLDQELRFTHKELIIVGEKWLRTHPRCGFIFKELASKSKETPDLIGWKPISSYLIECKTSRSDFFSDRNKVFRQNPEKGMGNYRYYLVPEGIITPLEIPDGWGLIYAKKRGTSLVKEPRRFASPKIARNERPILYVALRRINIRGDLDKIYDASLRPPRKRGRPRKIPLAQRVEPKIRQF